MSLPTRKEAWAAPSRLPTSSSVPASLSSSTSIASAPSQPPQSKSFRSRLSKIGSLTKRRPSVQRQDSTLYIRSSSASDLFRKTGSTEQVADLAGRFTPAHPDAAPPPLSTSSSVTAQSRGVQTALPRRKTPASVRSFEVQRDTAKPEPIRFNVAGLGRPISDGSVAYSDLLDENSPWSAQTSRFSGTDSAHSQVEAAETIATVNEPHNGLLYPRRSPAEARGHSPLQALINDLGGRRSDEGATSDATNLSPPMDSVPKMAAAHSDDADSVAERNPHRISVASSASGGPNALGLASAWSATNSAHSSRAHIHTETSSPEPDLPPTASTLQAFQHARGESLSSRPTLQPTPGSSRRWSMAEMEQAYTRMKDLFASSRGTFDASLALSQIDAESNAPSVGGHTPVLPSFPDQLASSQQTLLLPEAANARPQEGSYASEELDALPPLRSEQDEADSDEVLTPRTYVTSLSDPMTSYKLPPPQGEPSRSPQIQSTPDLDLNDFDKERGVQRATKSPSPYIQAYRHRSAESLLTSDQQEGWATPRTSLGFPSSQANSVKSADLVADWLDRSRLKPGAHMSRSDSSRSSRTAARSDGSVATVARGQSRSSPNGDGHFRPDSRNYNTWFADTPVRKRDRSNLTSYKTQAERYRSESSFSHVSTATGTSLTLTEFREADKLELYLKYSKMEAELEALKKQTGLEREAFLDALSETRNVVHDLRKQRNELQNRLDYLSKQRYDIEQQSEHAASLARGKTLWQERAQSLGLDVERHTKTIEQLRDELQLSRKQKEDLQNENVSLGSRIASLTGQLKEAKSLLDEYARAPQTTPTFGSSPTSPKSSVGSSEAKAEESEADDNTAKMEPVAAAPASNPNPSLRVSPKRLPTGAHFRSASASHFQTPTKMVRPRHISENGSIVDVSYATNLNETPLISQKPAFSQSSPASSIGRAAGSEAGSPAGNRTVKSKLPSPNTSKLPSPNTSKLPSPNASRIARAPGGGLPRLRHVSGSSSVSSMHRTRTPSISSIGTTPEEHQLQKGTTWTPDSSFNSGLNDEDDKFLSEIVEA